MLISRITRLASALLGALFVLLVMTPAVAEAPIEVWVDGKPIVMDVAPVIINGRTMVPARFVAEALGATVEWDQGNQRVVITSKETKTTARADIAAAETDTVSVRTLTDIYGVSGTTDQDGNLRLTKNGVTIVISVKAIQMTGSIVAPVVGHATISEARVFTSGGRTVMTKSDVTALGFLP